MGDVGVDILGAVGEQRIGSVDQRAAGIDDVVDQDAGVASDVAYGNASSYTQVTTATAARIEVTSPLSTTPLFLAKDVALPSRGVFTVFMLGGASTPTGVLRRER